MPRAQVDWADRIAAASDQFKNIAVSIIDPSLSVTSVYDPDTNEYTTTGDPIVASGIAARFQPVRMAVDSSGAPAYNAGEVRARIQIERTAYSGAITRGMRIRITEASRNPTLVDMIFYVDGNVNSGWRASNTIEVTTNVVNVES